MYNVYHIIFLKGASVLTMEDGDSNTGDTTPYCFLSKLVNLVGHSLCLLE